MASSGPSSAAPASLPIGNNGARVETRVAAGRAVNELDTAVDDLLDDMQTRFRSVSDEILNKMDDMSKRLDALETSIREGDSKAS